MSAPDELVSIATLRDLLKMHGAGGIAVVAISTGFEKAELLVMLAGIGFFIGLMSTLWSIRQIINNKDQCAYEKKLKSDIDFSGFWFAGSSAALCIGLVATYFGLHPDA